MKNITRNLGFTSLLIMLCQVCLAQSTISDGNYYIQAVHSGSCLDMQSVLNVHQFRCHGNDNQKWRVKRNDDDTYTFTSLSNNHCLEIEDGGTAHFTNIKASECKESGHPHQKFKLNFDGNVVQIQATHTPTPLCLDVSGKNRNDGTNIHLYTCFKGAHINLNLNQYWNFVPSNTTSQAPTDKKKLVFTSIDDFLRVYLNDEKIIDHKILRYNEQPLVHEFTNPLQLGDQIRVEAENGPASAELKGQLMHNGATIFKFDFPTQHVKKGIFYKHTYIVPN